MAPSTDPQGTARPGQATALLRAATAAGVAALLAACGSSTTTSTSSPSASAPATTAASPSAMPALPQAGTVAATIHGLPALTSADDGYTMASDGTSVWVYDGENGTLTRVAAATGTVTATIHLKPGCAGGNGCGNIALGDGAIWVANEADSSVTRVDVATNRAVATVNIGSNAAPLVYTTPGRVWTANYLADSYTRIDPASNRVAGTLSGHARPEAVLFADGSILLCDSSGTPTIVRLDPTSLAMQRGYDLKAGGVTDLCVGMVATGTSLLVTTAGDHTPPVRLDTASGQVTQLSGPPGTAPVADALIADGSNVWTVDGKLGLFRLDPGTGAAVAQTSVEGAAGIAGDSHLLWVMGHDGTLYKITPSAAS